MKKTIALAATVLGALILFWLSPALLDFSSKNNSPSSTSQSVDQNNSAMFTDQTRALISTESETSSALEQQEQPNMVPEQTPMGAQMAQIADAYEQSLRFPAYSKPLSEHDWQMLNPRAFTAKEVPMEGAPDLSVAIELNQYINDIREPLPVRVIAASPNPMVSSVDIALGAQTASTASVTLTAVGNQPNVQYFEGVLSPETLAAAGAGEILIFAQLNLTDGRSLSSVAETTLYHSAADLISLDNSYIDGADLIIPANFNVAERGYFRVLANLMDAESGQPISHINAEFVLSPDQPSGQLKVHSETLRAMQAPGPYVLTDFNIIRSPSWPGDIGGYGSASQATFDVGGFSLDAYSSEPYVDEQAQQRLDFLENLAEENNLP